MNVIVRTIFQKYGKQLAKVVASAVCAYIAEQATKKAIELLENKFKGNA